jgi:tRNA dimethylallyltransferase
MYHALMPTTNPIRPPLPTPADFAGSLVLTGATGSGKSGLALELAEQHGCEIVSMDSMTIYRHLTIGTAKPTAQEMARVPHHLVDVLDPWVSGSVAWWLIEAKKACEHIRSRGQTPLFVGGTPFYLKALLQGLFEAPAPDAELRAKLEAECAEIGVEAFHAKLMAVDAITAKRLHPNDTRRVVRALEVFHSTGQPISALQTTWDSPAFGNTAVPKPDIRAVVLDWPRDVLRARIEQRVHAMMAAGWLEEVRELEKLPRPVCAEAAAALGYPELRRHLAGELSLEEAVDWIIIRTQQFAKRQLTWFRGLRTIPFVNAAAPDLSLRVGHDWNRAAVE